MSSAARKQTSIRVDPEAWEIAKDIFKEYGLSASDAINVFLNKVRLERGFPFDIKVPNQETIEAMESARQGNGEEIDLQEHLQEMKRCITH